MPANPAAPSIYDHIASITRAVWAKLTTYRTLVILLLVLVTAGYILWTFADNYRQRRVILYTSTASGDAKRMGDQIQRHFEEHRPSTLVNYQIEVRPSEGLHENRSRVADAKPGDLVMGFDQDGFEPPNSVRTLIPLTEFYLHLVVRAADVTKAEALRNWQGRGWWVLPDREETAGSAAPTFNLLRDLWNTRTDEMPAGESGPRRSRKLPTCYLGPKGSGSRQLGERIVQHYGLPLAKVDYGSHIDWTTAYRMLREGYIDLIFDASDLGSPYLTDRAKEGGYALIGLDEIDGLVATHNSFLKRKIPRGTYVPDVSFCKADLNTVATQRLIICPKAMSSFDAYYLTTGIREALRQEIPDVRWEKTEGASRPIGLVVPLHDGVEEYRKSGSRPLLWVNSLFEKHWLAILGFVGGLIVWAYPHLRHRKPAPDAAAANGGGGTDGPGGPDGGSGGGTGPGQTPPGATIQPAITADSTRPADRPSEVVSGRPAGTSRSDLAPDPGPAAVIPASEPWPAEAIVLQVRCEYLHEELNDPLSGRPTEAFFRRWLDWYNELILDVQAAQERFGNASRGMFAKLYENLRKLRNDYDDARKQFQAMKSPRQVSLPTPNPPGLTS
jgi:hypothetical protein